MASGTIKEPNQIHFKEVSGTTDNNGNLYLGINGHQVVSCQCKAGVSEGIVLPFQNNNGVYGKVLNYGASTYTDRS